MTRSVKGIQFTTTPAEDALIKQMIDRMYTLPLTYHPARLQLTMDVTACHSNGCRLDLEGLLAADDRDFMHDVFGIRAHINRETGQLMDNFSPRYAARG